MALLDMCISSGVSCACAHVNYHHRPQADEEEAYIRNFCLEHSVPCYVKNDPFEWTGKLTNIEVSCIILDCAVCFAY